MFNKEVKISSDFGEEYLNSLEIIILTFMNGTKKGHRTPSFDLNFYDYSLNGKTITIFSEGTVGTSIIGKKKFVTKLINKIHEINPSLLDENCKIEWRKYLGEENTVK